MAKVKVAEARRFMIDCLKSVGANEKPAKQHAELLVQADIHGHQSHGLNRLGRYIKDIKTKACDPNSTPVIMKECPSTAWVDARNCLGSTASYFCTDIAMKKAKETGVGWVSVKGSNHNGMIGYWARLCADHGFIGLAFTNTSPLLTPTRSKKAALGTNPIAISAPAGPGETFLLEMATSAVALGAIEMRRRAGKKIPLGWALGPDGKETTDPEQAFKAALLMPLGGGEMTSGYKGYGLAAAVEILTGISAGSQYAHHVRSWAKATAGQPANIGHCFVAVSPENFAPGFTSRLIECMNYWRNLPPVDPKLPVLAPGDIEKKAAEATEKRGAILYLKQQIKSSANLAKVLHVKPMEVTDDLEKSSLK